MSGLRSRGQAGAVPPHGMGHHGDTMGLLRVLASPALAPAASQGDAQLKVRRQNLHSGGRQAEPLLCPGCPARARWQLSPSMATEPQSGLSSVYTALAPSKVSQHSRFSLTQAPSCVPCPLRHNVPAWSLRGSSRDSAVVEAERGPCVRHFALEYDWFGVEGLCVQLSVPAGRDSLQPIPQGKQGTESLQVSISL